MSNRNFSYILSPDILWGNVSSQSVTGLCTLKRLSFSRRYNWLFCVICVSFFCLNIGARVFHLKIQILTNRKYNNKKYTGSHFQTFNKIDALRLCMQPVQGNMFLQFLFPKVTYFIKKLLKFLIEAKYKSCI